ncbi:hypothetical protein D3C72_1738540 [compost metagenome]
MFFSVFFFIVDFLCVLVPLSSLIGLDFILLNSLSMAFAISSSFKLNSLLVVFSGTSLLFSFFSSSSISTDDILFNSLSIAFAISSSLLLLLFEMLFF